jgi:hypothetical protein
VTEALNPEGAAGTDPVTVTSPVTVTLTVIVTWTRDRDCATVTVPLALNGGMPGPAAAAAGPSSLCDQWSPAATHRDSDDSRVPGWARDWRSLVSRLGRARPAAAT